MNRKGKNNNKGKRKNTKTFLVDVHWDVAKTYEIIASSIEEAERIMEERINNGSVCVWTDGFEATEDVDVCCCGSINKDGEKEFLT